MELQSELSEKHSKEKQLWQKKEVELQNIVSGHQIRCDKWNKSLYHELTVPLLLKVAPFFSIDLRKRIPSGFPKR